MSAVRHIERDLTNSNGSAAKGLQGSLRHMPDQLPLKFRMRERFKKLWGRMVTKNQEGRYTVSQPLALSVLGFILIFGGTWYWRSSDTIQAQHDEIIRLKTMLEMESKKNTDQDSKIDQARNFATNADKNQARLEGKFDQFALQYGIKNAGKASNGQ